MVERLTSSEKFLQEKSYLYKLLSFFYILPSILGKICKQFNWEHHEDTIYWWYYLRSFMYII